MAYRDYELPTDYNAMRELMNQVEEIAKTKMPDLNTDTVEGAVQIVLGTARSMGIEVQD